MPFSNEKPIIQLKKIEFQQICTKKSLKEKLNVKKGFIENDFVKFLK